MSVGKQVNLEGFKFMKNWIRSKIDVPDVRGMLFPIFGLQMEKVCFLNWVLVLTTTAAFKTKKNNVETPKCCECSPGQK